MRGIDWQIVLALWQLRLSLKQPAQWMIATNIQLELLALSKTMIATQSLAAMQLSVSLHPYKSQLPKPLSINSRESVTLTWVWTGTG